MEPDDRDDLDELLNGNRTDLEARFRELEHEAEIERIRRESGGAAPKPPGEQSKPGAARKPGPAADDPLGEMKSALDGEGELERYLLVICPGCEAKNRMSLTKVRTRSPICGRCKQDLSFTKF